MLKRSQYPKELHIGTEMYKIKWCRTLPKDTLGECDPEMHEIRIKCGLTPEESLLTFIHEALHALLEFENDISIKHKLIYDLEKPIYQFIRDNFFNKAR